MSSYQPISLPQLREKFFNAQELMENRILPVDLLDEFSQFIIYLNEDPNERLHSPENTDLKKFFFGEFLNGLLKKMSQIRGIEQEHLHIIQKIVMTLCELFVKELQRDNNEMTEAMRYLFLQNCNLHQNLFQSEENLLAVGDPSIINKLPADELEWRKSLKEGDKIDAIKINHEYNLKTWAKAYIHQITGDILYIIFENDVRAMSARYIHWYSLEIDRYNTKSEGDEWRKELKIGDFIDAFDSTQVWYQSIVVGREVESIDGQEVIKLRVGFRMFHPDGNKEDDDHKKYFGWGDKFDETIPAYNPRIQRFQTFAKVIGEPQRDQQQARYEDRIEDQMDMLLYEKQPHDIPIYAVLRQRCKSTLLVQFLNRFGELGGYKTIVDKIKDTDNQNVTIELVFNFIDCLSNCTCMYNRVFLNDYLPELEKAVKHKILSMNQAQLRNAKKDKIDGIVHNLIGGLQSRTKSYKEREQDKCLLNLEIAALFLEQNFLERRIDGAKIIQDVCKTANLSTFTSTTETIANPNSKREEMQFVTDIISKIKEKKVLYQIFSQERGHSELVQRADDLLKLLISQNALNQEELQYVWASTKLDEATKLELFKIFHELSSRLKINEVSFIINQISTIPIYKLVVEELELVHELGKRARNQESQYGPLALDFFWRIIESNIESVDKNIMNLSANAIIDIIKSWPNHQKQVYIERMLNNLENNVEGLLQIKMLRKSLLNFTETYSMITSNKQYHDPNEMFAINENEDKFIREDTIPDWYKSRNNFICHLEYQYQLLDKLFENFKKYIFKARTAYRKKCEQDPNLNLKSIFDTVLCDKFVHSEQLSERLDFLKYVITNSHVQVQPQHIAMLWDELIVFALSVSDADLFYSWLRELCEHNNNPQNTMTMEHASKLDLGNFIEFLRVKLSEEGQSYRNLTLEGFKCIASFFNLVNLQSGKMIQVTSMDSVRVQKFTAYSSDTGSEFKSYSFNQNKKTTYPSDDEEFEFLINAEPCNIDGILAIWKISIEANEHRVYEQAQKMLVKLYSQVSFKLESQLPDFDDEFISKCINAINELRVTIQSREVQPKEEFERVEKPIVAFSTITSSTMQRILPPEEKKIMRYLQLLKAYIAQSERNGTLGVRSHLSLQRGELLNLIQLSSNLGNPKDSKKYEVALQSNSTLWDLRIFAARLNPDYNLMPERDEQGAVQLRQVILPDIISVYRYTGVTLLGDLDNGKTLAQLRFKPNEQLNVYEQKNASKQIPLMNEDRSDLSDNSKLVFTEIYRRFSIPDPENPDKRIMNRKTCAQFIQGCTEEDNVVEEDPRVLGFFEQYDQDQKNYITIEHFFDFYKTCALTKEHVVRDNLAAQKFRQTLNSFREENGIYIYQTRQRMEDMPRYKISNTNIYYDSIFNLLEIQGEIASSAWNLIKQITTKPDLYNKIKNLNLDPNFKWEEIIDTSSIYRMLYTLQIIESMLEDVPQTQSTNFELIQQKSMWIERFLSIGGFQEILKLFEVSLDMISKKHVDTLSKFEKSFLEYMLKLIKIFILSAFASNDQSVFELIQLVKRNSSMQDTLRQQEHNNTQQENEKQDVTTGQDIYQTPAKKIGQVVPINDKVARNINIEDVEITQEFLFGEQADNKPNNVGTEVVGQQSKEKIQNSTQHRLIENESERFTELAKIMRDTGLGDTILEKIDFKDLQNEILDIISLILGKKEIKLEDVQIMENNLSLWVTLLIKNEDLINDFYKYERTEEKAGMFGIKSASELLITGVQTYKSYQVKEEFANALLCIAQKVKNNKGKLFLFYMLELMQKHFPREDQYYATRECKEFFSLFLALIDDYILYQKERKPHENEEFDQMNQFDPFNLLQLTIEKLKRHESKEKKGSLIDDKTLSGYYQLIEKLIIYLSEVDKPKLQEVMSNTLLIHELFYEHLFFDIQTLRLDNKAKTKESRNACFQLLQKALETLEPKDLADFLENDLWSVMKDLQKPKTWRYVPAETSKQSSSYVGITNLGNICYMNAMLQQFFMVPQFRYQLLKAQDNSKPDFVKYKGREIDDNMLRQLQKMFGYLELSEKQEYNPFDFCFAFKDYEGNPTNTAIQSDTQEFLNIFFDRLEHILKPTSQKHLLDGVFGGNTCSQLICQSCGKTKNYKENFYNLSVPVKDRKSLDNSLYKMIEGSIINDFRCDFCNQKVDVFKRNLIGETPNVLIVHLQRLVFNFDTFQNDKINTRFEFPNLLNLKEYSFKHVMTEEGKELAVDEDEYIKRLTQMDDSEFIYKLVGVIIHRGTGQHGHYWSLINTKRGSDELDENKPDWAQTERDAWKEFNDETVKYFSFNELKQEAYGGSSESDIHDDEMSSYLFNIGGAQSYGKSAYMLVYERQKKKDLVVVQTKQVQVLQSETPKSADDDHALECADTANSRDDNNAQQTKEIQEEVLIPYRKVEPFVPDWIRADVNEDNVIFLMDRYIYHESFFNLLKAIFKHIANRIMLCQHQYKLDYIPHFHRLKKTVMKLAHKSVFELLSYYYYNSQLNDILQSIQSIVTFCDSTYTMNQNKESILGYFLELAFFQDSFDQFYKVALECTDKSSRYYICKLTSIIVNKVYSIYDELEDKENPTMVQLKAQADALLVHFISKLGDQQSYQNWSRLEQFMKMLYDIAYAGPHQARRFLSATDVIPHLMEFMLGNRSPYMKRGGPKKPLAGEEPYFEPIVQLICLLTRYTLTKEMVQYEETWDNSLNPPPSTLLGYNFNQKAKNMRFEMSEEALFYVFNSVFIDYIQYMGYDTLAVGLFLAHLSYKSFQTTRMVCESQLRGISKNDFDRVKHYLDGVTQIVLVKDNLQNIKLEWIFGIAQPVAYDMIITDPSQENEPTTRIGVKVLFSNNDEVFNYRSYLSTNDVLDSLLHLLWRYKGRMDSYTVSCLFSLLNIIASDENVAEYFSNIPGPTYQYARYTDWFKPYLNEQLIDARKGYAGTFSEQKEENVIKALSLYEKYEEYLDKKDGAKHSFELDTLKVQDNKQQQTQGGSVEENVKNLIDQMTENATSTEPHQEPLIISTQSRTNNLTSQSRIIPCTPPPYIIVDCIQENQINSINKQGVLLQTVSLDCTFTKSEPTGLGNLSMPKNLFRNFRDQRSNYHKNKEQELQSKCLNNYFGSKNLGNKANQRTTNITINECKVIQDDDKEWKKVNNQNVSDLDEDDGGYTQDQEGSTHHTKYNGQDADNNNDKQNNSGIDIGLDGEDVNNLQDNQFYNDINDNADNNVPLQQQPQQEEATVSYRIKVIEEGDGKDDNDVNQVNDDDGEYQTKLNLKGIVEYEDDNKQQQNDQPYFEKSDDDKNKINNGDEVVWPNPIHINQGLVQKYVACNLEQTQVRICLEFIEDYENEDYDNQHELYRYPKGCLEFNLNPNQTKTLIYIQKTNPWVEGGALRIPRLSVVQLDKNLNVNENYNNDQRDQQPETTTQQLQVIEESDDLLEENNGGVDPKINVSDSNIQQVIDGMPLENDTYGGGSKLVDGMKECGTCTFLQDASNTRCEMCYSNLD